MTGKHKAMLTRLWHRVRGLFAPLTEVGPRNARLGEAGERAAEAHLRAVGLRVVARNWRNPSDAREEIDLVCKDGETLVFIEVKARSAGSRVGGYHAVDKRKKRVLLRACRAYLARLRPAATHWRFDIVEVEHGADPAAREKWRAMRLPPGIASERDGSFVLHHREVPLFPERANHRHG